MASGPQSFDPVKLQEKVLQASQRAVDQHLKNFRVRLDYSVASLLPLDTILAQMRAYHFQNPGAGDMEVLSMMYGSYFGEVLRRTYGGAWSLAQFGETMHIALMYGLVCLRPIQAVRYLIEKHDAIRLQVLAQGYEKNVREQATQTTTVPPPPPPATVAVPATDIADVKESAGQSQPSENGLAEMMRKGAENAVNDVRTVLKKELDYTPETLTFVDLMLETIRKMIQQVPEQAPKACQMSAFKYGAYLGEVMRRSLGGIWVQNVPNMPAGVPALDLGNKYASPMAAIFGAIEGNGVSMGDGVVVRTASEYFQTFLKMLRGSLEERIYGSDKTQAAFAKAVSDDMQVSALVLEWLQKALVTAEHRWGTSLDFSEKSLAALETILEQLHDLLKTASPQSPGPNEQQLQQSYMMWGIYLGEVMRRHLGGKWHLVEDQQSPQRVLQLALGDKAAVWPLRKVQKRITAGPGDNVAFYFQATRHTMQNEHLIPGHVE